MYSINTLLQTNTVYCVTIFTIFILGQNKLIFCFSGTGAFVFSSPLQNFYLKNRAHIFVKLNFVLKKI